MDHLLNLDPDSDFGLKFSTRVWVSNLANLMGTCQISWNLTLAVSSPTWEKRKLGHRCLSNLLLPTLLPTKL